MARAPKRRSVLRLCAGVAVLVVVLGVAHASGLLLADSARPASVGDAVRSFRKAPARAGLAGVYVYATSGGESIDALGGAGHRYPAITTVTVRTVRCGLSLRWQPLKGRATTWTICTGGPGLELRGIDQLHRFFGQNDRTTYACSGGLIAPRGTARSFSCRTGSGGERISSTASEEASVTVKGRRLHALRVGTVARVSGASRGRESTLWWLDDRGLPLRIVLHSRTSRSVFVGKVHYREDAELRLLSTSPRR
ncbi:MAG: hypothetical protein ACXVY8_04035 [Gaiellaceae bacterium]